MERRLGTRFVTQVVALVAGAAPTTSCGGDQEDAGPEPDSPTSEPAPPTTEPDEGTPSPSPTESTETKAPADAPDTPDAHQDGGRDTTFGEVELAHGTDKVEAGVHGSST